VFVSFVTQAAKLAANGAAASQQQQQASSASTPTNERRQGLEGLCAVFIEVFYLNENVLAIGRHLGRARRDDDVSSTASGGGGGDLTTSPT
jgi:hypothetical protein